MSAQTPSLRTYSVVYLLLLLLLGATVGTHYLNLEPFNIVLAMGIAVAQALLIMLINMHVLYGSRLIWVIAGASFLWLTILLVLAMSDYLTRGLTTIPGK